MNASKQAGQSHDGINVGGENAQAPAYLKNGADNSVQLQSATRLSILKHGSLEGAKLGSKRLPILRALRYGAADVSTDRLCFDHGRGAESAYQGIGQDLRRRGAGDSTDRVDGQIAPELVPNVLAHIFAKGGLKACTI